MLKSGIGLLLTWSLTSIPGLWGKMEKISEHPSNMIVDFFAYRHVAVMHFHVPEGTVAAEFKFTAREKKTGGLFGCSSRDITIYVKAGSLPFVHPDNSTIETKILEHRQKHYHMMVESNGSQNTLKIIAPQPGDWFGWAIRTWSDPMKGRIKQQGLSASCDTIVDAAMDVEAGGVPLVGDGGSRSASLANVGDSSMMRFLVPTAKKKCTLSVSSSCGEGCTIMIKISAQTELARITTNRSKTLLPFKPWSSGFQYVTVSLVNGNSTDVSVTLEKDTDNDTSVKFIRLVKRSLPEFFLFDYEYMKGGTTKASSVDLEVGTMTVLTFEVAAIIDVGGTVTISMKHSEMSNPKAVVAACVNLGYHEDLTSLASCLTTERKHGPDITVYKTGPAKTNIIYPEPGTWYVSLKAFCGSDNCSCMNDCVTRSCTRCDCMTECAASVDVVVASSPCIEGRCGKNGKCDHYMSGGFVFSACHCTNGYRGWDCTDRKYVLGSVTLLGSLLFLTLSNLVFIGSIYFAIRRAYYTEAIAYTSVMFFSTFYHACESGEDLYNFCIMRVSVLQFCDFYCALLSIWVTLVAMAYLGPILTPFCQMTGAILLAFAAEMDRTALWVFMMPAASGSVMIGIAWGRRCKRLGNFKYPASPYRLRWLPMGLGLVGFGLICFAFLQTRSNYWVVHSIWHMMVAGGVMLLLPFREYML